jgi:hypothetical protein
MRDALHQGLRSNFDSFTTSSAIRSRLIARYEPFIRA